MSNYSNTEDLKFSEIYLSQIENQSNMLESGLYEGFTELEDTIKELPFDNVKLFSYHIQQLFSELGEVLDADKRWKNFRNGKYNSEQKLEELADCFIVLMNMCMFSGYSAADIVNKIKDKINVVSERIKLEKSKEA